MRRRDHPVFYNSKSSSNLKRSTKSSSKGMVSRCDVETTPCFTIRSPVWTSTGAPKGAQKGASDPKLSQEGPRTPPVQWWSDFLEAKRAQKGAVLRLKIEPKIVLDSGAEKVVNIDAPRLANRTLGTSSAKCEPGLQNQAGIIGAL